MKFVLIILLIFNINILSQEKREGEITFISSQNIYVKFENTEGMKENDTIYIEKENKYIPTVLVKYISSRSIAGELLNKQEVKIGDKVFISVKLEEIFIKNEVEESIPVFRKEAQTKFIERKKKNFFGRISVQSNSSLSNTDVSDIQRWRYSFSSSFNNLLGEKLNIETNLTYSYRVNDPNLNGNALSKNLRVYNLNGNYKFDLSSFTLGRHFNRNARNIGAIDGLSYNYLLNEFSFGAIIGSRPDIITYGYNLKLFQYGIYIARTDSFSNGKMENSLVLFQQTNNFKTDRRFIYFQHSNYLLKKVYLFLSTEIDLFKIQNSISKNELSLTGLYLMTRYSPEKWISFSTSYDARRNVIYYETFSNYADSLFENELRQGLKLSIFVKPYKNLFINLQNGIRIIKNENKNSTNYSGSINYSDLPYLGSSLTFLVTGFNNKYSKGNQIGFSLSKDISVLNLFTIISYKTNNISLQNINYQLKQNILSFDLSSNLFEEIYTTLSIETIFEGKISYKRLFLHLNKRF